MKKCLLMILGLFWLTTLPTLAEENVGYLITWDNPDVKVELYKQVSLDDFLVRTYNAAGKFITYKRKNVKKMVVHTSEYISVQTNKVQKHTLVQVMAKSDKYILVSYFFENAQTWLICDIDGNKVFGTIDANRAQSFKEKQFEMIRPYFAECKQLMDQLEKNKKMKGTALLEYVNNIQCE